jgi:single-strand DNA-binding protein
MINEAILVGHVGKKDIKKLNNGSDFTMISLATTTKFMDSSGEKQVRTTWHNISFFSKLAEIAAKYVHVGDLIYVRGEIHNKKIEQGERAGQYVYSVVAQDVKFLPGKKKDTDNSVAEKPQQQEFKQYNKVDLDNNIPF